VFEGGGVFGETVCAMNDGEMYVTGVNCAKNAKPIESDPESEALKECKAEAGRQS